MSASATKAPMEWPDLQELVTELVSMPVTQLPRLLGLLRELEATALSRLYAAPRGPETARESEQLLNVEEAANRLNVSQDYLYRHWRKLPFAQKYDWGLRFSARGIDDYIRHGGMSVYTPRNKRSGGNQ